MNETTQLSELSAALIEWRDDPICEMLGIHYSNPIDLAAFIIRSPWLQALIAQERALALRELGDEITRELICCDVYERLSPRGVETWTADERREYRTHSICYWGAASRALANDRAEQEEGR